MTDYDEHMAPPHLGWHRRYVEAHMRINKILEDLRDDPEMKGAEDLGDWIETIDTLISFRPQTRNDIEADVRAALMPELYPKKEVTQ